MAGINLDEESQLLGSTDSIETEIPSCKEESLLATGSSQKRIGAVIIKGKKKFSSINTEDIIDVAVIAGINLDEESQLLGPTESIETQIPSCKEKCLLATRSPQKGIGSVILSGKNTYSTINTEDDINDVAIIAGINLDQESQHLGPTESIDTQISLCKEQFLLEMEPLQKKMKSVLAKNNLDEPSSEVAAFISHIIEDRLRHFIERLSIITEHRLQDLKNDSRYEVTHDIKGQLKFLQDVDIAERRKDEELEREVLYKAAKRPSRSGDPELAESRAKVKKMQKVEMEEMRWSQINSIALQAIGPRKKLRIEGDAYPSTSQAASGQLSLRVRMKKATLKDLQFLFETDKELCKSSILYKLYLK